jgi:hypothetical protein
MILRYSDAGLLEWSNSWDSNSMFDIANKVSFYDDDIIVAGGAQQTTSKWEYAVVSFAKSDGSAVDSNVSNSTANGIDQIYDLHVDVSGNIYVTGGVANTSTGYDVKTIKLDTNLTVQWTVTYNGSDNLDDKGQAVKVDASGNVFVTGFETTTANGKDFLTIKYNSSGTQQWVKSDDGGENGNDSGRDLVIGSGGNIYVTGYSFNGSNEDYLTKKYSTSGDLIWEITYNGLYNGEDRALDICLDDEGDIIVVGQSNDGDNFTYTAIKYTELDIIYPPDPETQKPMSILKNVGQITNTDDNQDQDVKYYTKSFSPTMFFKDDTISFVLKDSNETSGYFDYWRVNMNFLEPSENLKVRSFEEKDYFTNYYKGRITNRRERLSSFENVLYFNVYDNVDLIYSSNRRGVKYYYVIKPGGSPSEVRNSFSGADSISIGASNEIIISTGLGDVSFEQPHAYQIDANGNFVTLSWQPTYTLNSTVLTYSIGTYDTSLPLVIEVRNTQSTTNPNAIENLTWCSYIGGRNRDETRDICIVQNTVYITGITQSIDFPSTVGLITGYNNSSGNSQPDVFVYAMNTSTNVVWESLYGGGGSEIVNGIVTQNSNTKKTYIVGRTNSPGFDQGTLPIQELPFRVPVDLPGAYMDQFNPIPQMDMFIARFDEETGELDWSTFFGGGPPVTIPPTPEFDYEEAYDIALTNQETSEPSFTGDIYIVGKGGHNTPYTLPVTYTDGWGVILRFDSNLELEWASRYPVRTDHFEK